MLYTVGRKSSSGVRREVVAAEKCLKVLKGVWNGTVRAVVVVWKVMVVALV
jgi:hypothetical protein